MSTELQIHESNTRPVSRSIVRDGVAGNYEVVYAMARIIRGSVDGDKPLEDFSVGLLAKDGETSYTDNAQILATVYNYVKSHVRYITDIAGRVESLKSARQTLSDGYGDCDDHAVLNCSILGCLGFDKVFIAMARYSQDVTSFQHVYCVCYVDGKRYVLDTTLPDGQLNSEVPAIETKEISVFDHIQGLDGVAGIWTNTRHFAKTFGKALVEFAPSVASQLPMGLATGNAFAIGAQMIDGSMSNAKTVNTLGSTINVKLDEIIISLMRSQMAVDLAKAMAVQHAAQLSTIERTDVSADDYKAIKQSINQKLQFIKNFERYASDNDIKVVHSNPHLMLASGVLLTVGVGFMFYKGYKARF